MYFWLNSIFTQHYKSDFKKRWRHDQADRKTFKYTSRVQAGLWPSERSREAAGQSLRFCWCIHCTYPTSSFWKPPVSLLVPVLSFCPLESCFYQEVRVLSEVFPCYCWRYEVDIWGTFSHINSVIGLNWPLETVWKQGFKRRFLKRRREFAFVE